MSPCENASGRFTGSKLACSWRFFSTRHIENCENKEKNTSMQKKCHPSGRLWRRCQLRKWDLRADAGVDVLLKKKHVISAQDLYMRHPASCTLHPPPPHPPEHARDFCVVVNMSEGTHSFFIYFFYVKAKLWTQLCAHVCKGLLLACVPKL